MLHYIGVFTVVHLMAKRLELCRVRRRHAAEIQGAVWRDGWANVIPLIALLAVLFSGYTPYMSAFCGISLAIIVGAARRQVSLRPLSTRPLFIAFVVWKYLTEGFELPIDRAACAPGR